jgi:hypothetical protein
MSGEDEAIKPERILQDIRNLMHDEHIRSLYPTHRLTEGEIISARIRDEEDKRIFWDKMRREYTISLGDFSYYERERDSQDERPYRYGRVYSNKPLSELTDNDQLFFVSASDGFWMIYADRFLKDIERRRFKELKEKFFLLRTVDLDDKYSGTPTVPGFLAPLTFGDQIFSEKTVEDLTIGDEVLATGLCQGDHLVKIDAKWLEFLQRQKRAEPTSYAQSGVFIFLGLLAGIALLVVFLKP